MVPQYIIDYLVQHNFRKTINGYKVDIKNQKVDHVTYYNCCVYVGTWASNYFTVKVLGFDERDEEIHDITRKLHPGASQFVERYYTNDIISGLAKKAVSWSL